MTTLNFVPDFLLHYNISSFFKNPIRGGQKEVYFPIRNNKECVLKYFAGGKDDRFDREMSIYDKYKDLDGIPKVLLIDEYNGNTIVFEEYIEGNALNEILQNYLGNESAIRDLMKKLFIILTPIWSGRYVHRDIKPENIVIRPDGSPVILDFGIARDLDAASITNAGFQLLSWLFGSPEQYKGIKDMISYRTDFFSLGILTYYLYHGQLPFGNTKQEIDNKFQSGDESFNCDSNFNLKNFCIECLKFSPTERPRSITDLSNLL